MHAVTVEVIKFIWCRNLSILDDKFIRCVLPASSLQRVMETINSIKSENSLFPLFLINRFMLNSHILYEEHTIQFLANSACFSL